MSVWRHVQSTNLVCLQSGERPRGGIEQRARMITERELMTSFGRVLTREEEKGVHIVGRVCVRTCFEILYEEERGFCEQRRERCVFEKGMIV